MLIQETIQSLIELIPQNNLTAGHSTSAPEYISKVHDLLKDIDASTLIAALLDIKKAGVSNLIKELKEINSTVNAASPPIAESDNSTYSDAIKLTKSIIVELIKILNDIRTAIQTAAKHDPDDISKLAKLFTLILNTKDNKRDHPNHKPLRHLLKEKIRTIIKPDKTARKKAEYRFLKMAPHSVISRIISRKLKTNPEQTKTKLTELISQLDTIQSSLEAADFAWKSARKTMSILDGKNKTDRSTSEKTTDVTKADQTNNTPRTISRVVSRMFCCFLRGKTSAQTNKTMEEYNTDTSSENSTVQSL